MDIDHLIIKHSTVTDKVPEPEDLSVGELAINTADGLAFTKHSDGTIVPVGGMQASVYDPQNISGDAFDRANHTGTQAIATVSGLQASLDGKEPANANIQSHISSTGNVHGVTAEQIIGLGTAAMADSSAFATATQGGKADSALQPNAGLAAIDSAANTKLGGIAAGATANATDAQLRDRSTHTGTQPMESIGNKQGKVLDDLIEIEDVDDIDTTFAVGGYIIKEDDLNGFIAGATMLVSANGGVVSQLISVPLLGKIALRRYEAGVWGDMSFTIAPFDVQMWYSSPTTSAADAVINADGTFSRSLFVPAPLAPKITASLTAASDTDILRPAALTTATTFPNPTGSPMDGFGFVIELIDDGTARALTWGSDYAAGFAALPTTTTAGKLGQIAVQYRSGKYRCDGVRWMA